MVKKIYILIKLYIHFLHTKAFLHSKLVKKILKRLCQHVSNMNGRVVIEGLHKINRKF